jgi:hypothetical protein
MYIAFKQGAVLKRIIDILTTAYFKFYLKIGTTV